MFNTSSKHVEIIIDDVSLPLELTIDKIPVKVNLRVLVNGKIITEGI